MQLGRGHRVGESQRSVPAQTIRSRNTEGENESLGPVAEWEQNCIDYLKPATPPAKAVVERNEKDCANNECD